jgi:uncharacterized protein (TIGR00661 family)
MKYLFLVQGEGRGHMTQAISFAEILSTSGHELLAVGIGRNDRRKIPDYFQKSFNCPIVPFESPTFVCDAQQKKIRIGATILSSILHSPTYWKSIQTIQQLVETYQPDVILNFYELLGGVHQFFFRSSCDYWVIGHQYLSMHEDFPFAQGRLLQKWLFQWNTAITAIGASKYLALSFRPFLPSKNPRLQVLPPLLRKQLFDIQPTNKDFILAYMVNPGYAAELIEQAQQHPDLKIEAFWDNKDHSKPYQALENLTFYPINDHLFLEKMGACRAYISTAGFESICEAMYLGKPVMMIPVAGQYEQACNAIDAELAGAGIWSDRFDLDALQRLLKMQQLGMSPDRSWLSKGTMITQKTIPGEKCVFIPERKIPS